MVDFAVDVSCGALLMTSPKTVYHCTAGVRLDFIDTSGHGVEVIFGTIAFNNRPLRFNPKSDVRFVRPYRRTMSGVGRKLREVHGYMASCLLMQGGYFSRFI
jgi:hypothetical protein